jgi:hypothetical protein
VVNLIIKLSSDPKSLAANKTFLTKLNMVLVQIVKQEWPEHWPNFIPELVNSSKTSQSLCANNMNILMVSMETESHMTPEDFSFRARGVHFWNGAASSCVAWACGPGKRVTAWCATADIISGNRQ